MNIIINFWLKGRGKDAIDFATIYDLNNDPFKVGDKFYLDVEDLWPKTLKTIPRFFENFKTDAENFQNAYHRKKFKIVKKAYSFKINPNNTFGGGDKYSLSVDYYIKQVPVFYWKWWFIKSRIKKIIKTVKNGIHKN